MNELKLKPFNIEAIKAGAKCVDEHGQFWTFESEIIGEHDVPYSFHRDDVLHWFTKEGTCFSSRVESKLFTLDETPTTPMNTEPTYRLLNIGEEILAE